MTKSTKKTSNPYKQTDWKKQLSSISIPDFKDDIFQRKKMTWSKKGGPKGRRVSGTVLPGLKTLSNKTPLPKKAKGRSVGRRAR